MSMPRSSLFQQLERAIVDSGDNSSHYDNAAQVLVNLGSPSTSVAILDDGKIETHCFSVLDHDEDTIFQACSISKAISGLCHMRLIEDGYYTLSDKICDRLPSHIVEWLTIDPSTREHVLEITIEQVMSHTAGISVHGFPGYPQHDKLPTTFQILTGRVPCNTFPVRLITLPGLSFMYSGGGITLLQCIVEHVMQRCFADVMDAYVLEPLGMTRSHFGRIDLEKESNFAKAYYTGITPCEPNEWHTQPELSAAGLWTTPKDLLKAARAVQSSLNGDSDAFLKQESAQKMLTLVKESMALSWFAHPNAFDHGGSNHPGYRCHLVAFADLPFNFTQQGGEDNPKCVTRFNTPKNCGVSVMTNSAAGDLVQWKIMHAIAYLKGWPHIPLPMGRSQAWMPLSTRENVGNNGWRKWIGDDWADEWSIAEDQDGQPTARLNKLKGTVRLRPALIAPKEYGQGRTSINLVLEGRQLMLRFGWDKSEPIIEVWNGQNASAQILRKKT